MPNELMRHVPKGALIVVMTFCTNRTIRENPEVFILIIARSFLRISRDSATHFTEIRPPISEHSAGRSERNDASLLGG